MSPPPPPPRPPTTKTKTETKANLPKNIAIIGAGIGGLALALGLLQQKVPYTLYEAASEYSTIGAGIGLGPNALRAMDMISPRFRDLYSGISTGNLSPEKNHVMMDAVLMEEGFGLGFGSGSKSGFGKEEEEEEEEKKKKKKKKMGLNGLKDMRTGTGMLSYGAEIYERTSAHRKALLDIMTSLIPLSTVKFKKRVKSIRQNEKEGEEDRGVTIYFEDGEVVEASAVIGCDGVKGATRSFTLGEKYPDHVEATYSGKYVYRAILPMKDAMDILGDEFAGDAKMFMGPRTHMTTFPISKGQECNVVAFKLDDRPWTHPEWTRLVSREELLADFEEDVDRRLVKLLDWAKPLQWSAWHHLHTPIYYNGLVCLLGDSAHAMTPHQAAGAGQCLEDALVLSRLLGRANSIDEIEIAFKVYDSKRRPRAQKIVETSQETGSIYAFTHPEFGDDMNRIVEELNRRFLWIWEFDLGENVRNAECEFDELVGSVGV